MSINVSDDVELLSVAWTTVKEYISARDRQTAADHMIEDLSDKGLSDESLRVLAATDSFLKHAVEEHLNEEIDDDADEFSDEEDY